MANFTTNTQIDFNNPGYFYNVAPAQVLSASSSLLRVVSPDGYQDYTGYFGFYYSNGYQYLNWPTSTLTGLKDYSSNWILEWSVTGLNIAGSVYYSYASGSDFQGLKTYAFRGNDSISGSAYNDVLLGYSGNDNLIGQGGNDTLNGGAGVDSMSGGLGNDTYYVDHVADVATELAGQGSDTVRSSVNYNLRANVEHLVLTGAAVLNGTGNTLANSLTGNSGNNVLGGLGGNDTLTGGLGADKFRFVFANEGMDSITDFSRTQGDKLMFVSPNFGGLQAIALAASRFRSNVTGSALDADDRFMFNTTSKILSYDADGNGAGTAVQIAKLTNGANLMASDIQIVAS